VQFGKAELPRRLTTANDTTAGSALLSRPALLPQVGQNDPFEAAFIQKTAQKPEASYRRPPDWTVSFSTNEKSLSIPNYFYFGNDKLSRPTENPKMIFRQS
jgi:hypothetical protein